ncbi:HAD-IA family hydrolase [Psychromonas ossibalaenae]|uniref:HAD-IA family hydrolase n=1 Tax=Psychromonas ossibalaenae TaxID=444922 RepID=UPI00037C61B7|nr:HAD-IA family hydrolase [Psychromonas ossibalaenae]
MIECKNFIFDVDATLVDTEVVIENIWKIWSEAAGVEFSEIQRHIHGRKIGETLSLVNASFANIEQEELVKKIASQQMTKATPIPGALDFIEQLVFDSWAIATSGPLEVARTSLTASGFVLPEVMVCAEDVERGKPDPMPFLLAAERLGVQPNECVVFEDSPAGVKSAKEAGCFTIALLTTHTESDLKDADLIVSGFHCLSVIQSNGIYVLALK